MINHGDCVEVMAQMAENSVDAIVCDPPYGLEFMGKEWDRLWDGRARGTDASPGYVHPVKGKSGEWRNAPTYVAGPAAQKWHHRWATAALRVAKPGAYLLAFGGTRTSHRLACAIEDAGWIIRDTLVWAYASGFPKSKASLKPAWEPIVMARKPGPLRELAIDACRIGFTSDADEQESKQKNRHGDFDSVPRNHGIYSPDNRTGAEKGNYNPPGRWPSNIILTDPIFDGGWDGVVGGGWQSSGARVHEVGDEVGGDWHGWQDRTDVHRRGSANEWDSSEGTYSRFFLIPKASRSDREPNDYGKLVGGLEEQNPFERGGPSANFERMGSKSGPRINSHATVKPTELMRHLVRLVTPQGGTVLDPFLGSGTTAIAAEQEGFAWIGIEREAEYIAIAEARLAGAQRGLGLDVPAPTPRKGGKERGNKDEDGNPTLGDPTATKERIYGFFQPKDAA